jgi:hypothetical protein
VAITQAQAKAALLKPPSGDFGKPIAAT